MVERQIKKIGADGRPAEVRTRREESDEEHEKRRNSVDRGSEHEDGQTTTMRGNEEFDKDNKWEIP